MTIDQKIEALGKHLLEEAARRYNIQGHNYTGSLIDKAEVKLKKTLGNFDLNLVIALYGIFLDKGVKAQNVCPSRAYIEAMIQYGKRKGVEDPKGFAFAVRNKHLREGIPTAASARFSKNGRRKGWLTDTINELLKENYFDTKLADIFQTTVEAKIEGIFQEAFEAN